MKKKELKELLLKHLIQYEESVGYKHGDIKNVFLTRCSYSDTGKIGIFFKNCKPFETYKGLDTRPVEVFTYTIDIDFEEDDETGEETEIASFVFDLHFDCNGKDEEWIEKKLDRQSDKEFFSYWI